jgi:Domain of unknown function (DUF4129)
VHALGSLIACAHVARVTGADEESRAIEPKPSRFARLRPISARGAALLGIALFVLLALVAVASRAHETPGGSPGIHEPPRGVGNYVFSIFAVLAVTMFFVLVWFWFSERDLLAEHHRKQTSRGLMRALVLLVLLALVFALASRLDFLREWRQRTDNAKVHPGQPTSSDKKKKTGPASPEPPDFKWLPVFIATGTGMLLLGFLGLRSARRARGELLTPYLLEREFESLLEDTLADLYAEKDARKAIIAAYARMERLFATYGIPRRPTEAPMEYLDRILGELRASGSALRRLTALFQWAKFSDHPVDATMRNEAIEALTRVRDELKANREEDELRRQQAEDRQGELADIYEDKDRTFGKDPFKEADEKARGSLEGRRTS